MPWPLVAAAICGILALALPSRGRAAPSHQHSHGGPLVVIVAVIVAAVAVAAANRQRIVQVVAAKPPPPKVIHATQVITRYVPVPTHAGHPLLSGWALVVALLIGGCVLLGVVALIVHAVRSFS